MELQLKSNDDIEVYSTATNYYRYKTMLGFRNGGYAYVFSIDDFERFNAGKHIISSDIDIYKDTIIL